MIYTKDINIFEKIDTEAKAYWIGMLMADGSIAWGKKKDGSIKYYGVKFGLTDIDVMNKWKEFLCIDKDFPYQILNQKNCQPVYYLYVTCHKMAEDLVRHGMVKNKDYRTQIPDMCENLKRHFIRGYFDGDGCIYLKDKKLKNGGIGKRKFISITSCSNKILHQIEQTCKNNNLIRKNKTHVKYPKTYNNKTHPPFFGLTNRMDVHNFLDWIYKDAIIYMDRKYNLYMSIKNDELFNKGNGMHIKSTQYSGVTTLKRKTKNKYHASLIFNGISYNMGYFDTPKKAALAYNSKIKELNLPNGMLNKIED